jgi:translation initiation factor 4A
MLSSALTTLATGQIESNYDETVDSFDDMNLKAELLRGRVSMIRYIQLSQSTDTAFQVCTPMASSARLLSSSVLSCQLSRVWISTEMPLGRYFLTFLTGHDVIAQAQSGTGKTATFSISVLQKIDQSLKQCQALILAPTRELAQQIQKVVVAIGDFMNIECHACIGGTSVRDDMKALQEGPQVVVGTPGRVHDMIQRRFLKTDGMKMFVLDEADEMLSVRRLTPGKLVRDLS